MKIKNEKGSITIFVLVGLLFMSAFLIISYASNVNKSKIVEEQSSIMGSLYMKNDNIVDSYEEVYSALRKKNKQILTANVEDSNTIELTNTFEENLYNYKIYGRTISEKDNDLPVGYKAIEYIESTGEQYINTGYTPKSNTRWEMDLQFTEIIADTPQFNGRYDGGKRFDIAISSAGQFQLNINDSNNVAAADTNRHMFFLDSKNLKVGYDDSSFNVSSALLESSVTVGLFGRHESGNTKVRYYCNQKLYSCSFYEDGVLVSYMQPCLDSEGIPCLYDKIRQITLYNQTDSDFKYEDIKDKKCVGDLITDSTDSNYQKYNIPIKITNNKGESQTINIYLNKPLSNEERIDFKNGIVVRNDGTTENIDLPEISIFEDYTKIEILTEVIPSKIEVEYVGYSLDGKYIFLEYIESTGTQYIDIGYKPNQDSTVEIYGRQINQTNNSLFGVNPYFVITSGNSKYRFRYNNTAIDTVNSSNQLVRLKLAKNKAYINGELVGTFVESEFQTTNNAVLFARVSETGKIEEMNSSRIYYAKIKDNDTLIRDLYPCYRVKDNVIGMYDKVNNVFYTNNGTGEFVAGPEV